MAEYTRRQVVALLEDQVAELLGLAKEDTRVLNISQQSGRFSNVLGKLVRLLKLRKQLNLGFKGFTTGEEGLQALGSHSYFNVNLKRILKGRKPDYKEAIQCFNEQLEDLDIQGFTFTREDIRESEEDWEADEKRALEEAKHA